MTLILLTQTLLTRTLTTWTLLTLTLLTQTLFIIINALIYTTFSPKTAKSHYRVKKARLRCK
jgi:hypothetical protein